MSLVPNTAGRLSRSAMERIRPLSPQPSNRCGCCSEGLSAGSAADVTSKRAKKMARVARATSACFGCLLSSELISGAQCKVIWGMRLHPLHPAWPHVAPRGPIVLVVWAHGGMWPGTWPHVSLCLLFLFRVVISRRSKSSGACESMWPHVP